MRAKKLRIHVDLPLKDGRKRKITIPVIPPHEILHAVHRAGKLQFHISMLGSDGYENIKVFWENALRQTWGRCHPAAVNTSRLRKTIPVVIHIDGVATYTDSEANIYSLSSALASGCTWDTKFVLCVVPVLLALTKRKKRAVNVALCKFFGWSMQHAMDGFSQNEGTTKRRGRFILGVQKWRVKSLRLVTAWHLWAQRVT